MGKFRVILSIFKMATRNILYVVALSIVSSAFAEYPCDSIRNGEFIPHEYDCQKYYVCQGGAKVLESCIDGRYFSYSRQACVEPNSADCSYTYNPGNNNTGDVTPGPNPTICYGVGVDDYVPDPYDCNKYVNCYYGAAYIMSCPNGLWFDSVTKKCLQPTVANCVEAPTFPGVNAICYGVSAGHVALKPILGYCQYYYKCVGNAYTVEMCASGMFFDESRDTCDFANLVNCAYNDPNPITTENPILQHTTEISLDPRCNNLETSYWPHPASCAKFIECLDGHSYEVSCPTGYYFDDSVPSAPTCTAAELTPCGRNLTTTREPPGTTPPGFIADPDCPYPVSNGKVMPYPGSCTYYYLCWEGKKFEMECPYGYFWHQAVGTCDYQYISACYELPRAGAVA